MAGGLEIGWQLAPVVVGNRIVPEFPHRPEAGMAEDRMPVRVPGEGRPCLVSPIAAGLGLLPALGLQERLVVGTDWLPVCLGYAGQAKHGSVERRAVRGHHRRG